MVDNQFYNTLVSQYFKRIVSHKLSQEDQSQMPNRFRQGLELFDQKNPDYQRLVEAIAQWYALMELSEDLLDRVQLYGISDYLDEEAAKEKLEKNWKL